MADEDLEKLLREINDHVSDIAAESGSLISIESKLDRIETQLAELTQTVQKLDE